MCGNSAEEPTTFIQWRQKPLSMDLEVCIMPCLSAFSEPPVLTVKVTFKYIRYNFVSIFTLHFLFFQILVHNLEFWVIVWSRLLLWTEFRSIEQNFRRIPITASLTKLKNTRHWLEICSTFFGFRQIFRSEFCQKSRRQQNSWKILEKFLEVILHFCNSSYF